MLAAAVTAKADIIVTSNLRHFQAEALIPWNLKAQHPDIFLTRLYDLYPDLMVQVVRRQSRDLKKPPLTVTELLQRLSNEVPQVASNILFYEHSHSVVETAKKALKSKLAKRVPEGGQCFDGRRYRLWQGHGILTITSKDNRGEILRVQNGEIEGNLSFEDIEAFQIFDRSLEQELAQARNIQQSKPIE